MDWIIDCSFAAALFLPSNHSPAARSFFSHLGEDDSLWVPSIWWYEMANVLVVAQRRKTLSAADISKIFFLIESIPLNTYESIGAQYSTRLHETARQYKLSAYDAAYLDLAIRKGAKLASLDNALLDAAKAAGVAVLP